MAGSYYPHGGPTGFSYNWDFFEKHGKTAMEAGGKLYITGLSQQEIKVDDTILNNIKTVCDSARANELAYLKRHHFHMDNSQSDWANLIRGINEVLSTKDVFENNLALLNQYTQDSKTNEKANYRSVDAFFGSYLQTAARRSLSHIKNLASLNGASFRQWATDVINSAVKDMLNATNWVTKDNKIITNGTKEEKEQAEEIHAYAKILQVLGTINNQSFFDDIINIYHLDTFMMDTQKAILENRKNGITRGHKGYQAMPKLTSSNYATGNAAEVLRNMIRGQLGGYSNTISNGLINTSIRIGQEGAKVDRSEFDLYSVTNSMQVINDLGNYGDDRSKRVNAIENAQRMYNDLQGAKGEIVEISDKNYLINANFKAHGGFEAQGDTTLRNLGALLVATHAPFNVVEVINFLSNCGADMLLGEAQNEVLEAIATQIANFLFDDVSITVNVPRGINVVHVFDLSGIYMPLSVILDGYYQALLGQLEGFKTKDFVSVSFKHGEDTPAKEWPDASVFTAYRQSIVNQSTVRIKFLADFADFVTQTMSGNIPNI